MVNRRHQAFYNTNELTGTTTRYVRMKGKYMPHQGKKEQEKRRKRLFKQEPEI